MTTRGFVCAIFAFTGCDSTQPASSPEPDSAQASPADEVVAIVLGTSIRRRDLESEPLDRLICAPLYAKYRGDKGISATKAEIAECAKFFQEFSQSNAWQALVAEEAEESDDHAGAITTDEWREIAEQTVIEWKTCRQLYEDFGGTVVFQQANPLEPVGAYLAFLQQQERTGAFRILDAELAEPFWADLQKPPQFVVPPERVDYSTPWWKKGR